MVDQRGGTSIISIVCEGSFIEVKNTRSGGDIGTAISKDGKETYEFMVDRWLLKR
jgi:hypothetical protein